MAHLFWYCILLPPIYTYRHLVPSFEMMVLDVIKLLVSEIANFLEIIDNIWYAYHTILNLRELHVNSISFILTNAICNYITIHGILYFIEIRYQISSENGPNFIVISMTFNYIITAHYTTSCDKYHEGCTFNRVCRPEIDKYLNIRAFHYISLNCCLSICFVRLSAPTLFSRLFFVMVWWIDLKLAV